MKQRLFKTRLYRILLMVDLLLLTGLIFYVCHVISNEADTLSSWTDISGEKVISEEKHVAE